MPNPIFTDTVLASYPSAFRAGILFIMGGDRDGHDDDSAPGEAFKTRYGITAMSWDYAAAHGIVTGTLADATPQQIVAVYWTQFWRAAGCDLLAPAVGFMVFNDATLTGVGHAARMLQRIVGAVVDGAVGPETRLAAGQYGMGRLIVAIATADKAYLDTRPTAALFSNGWDRREDAALAEAEAGIGVWAWA